ncbi:hypothetical protein S7711_04509 [Stachybotrys chartarum IBT 7711]|uniref:Uncharacterized protein n=1 Tax=Stachybotrys chartarum (strain CBS 109288 / IBT 7711) TaxID=1280523 RepID=A0A084BA95_STACB|nr:hypothetical protein S7711_04509 [Stachybotrys chartarum IBT 7711]
MSQKGQKRTLKAGSKAKKPIAGTSFIIYEEGVSCWDEDKQAVSILPASVANRFDYRNKALLPKTSSNSRLIFPLSSDHLIILVQLNTLRAVMTINRLVSKEHYDCAGGAILILPLDGLPDAPPNLSPTLMQATVPHEDWIDIMPHPVWRDNLILWSGTFDKDELSSDIVGGLFEGAAASDCGERGIVVWSPVWHPMGWELSEGFLRKWGWVIQGCEEEVLTTTNRWRAKRGEAPLTINPL